MSALVYDLTPLFLVRRVDAAACRPADALATLFICTECGAGQNEKCVGARFPCPERAAVSSAARADWLLRTLWRGGPSPADAAPLDSFYRSPLALAIEAELVSKERSMEKPLRKARRRTFRVVPPKEDASYSDAPTGLDEPGASPEIERHEDELQPGLRGRLQHQNSPPGSYSAGSLIAVRGQAEKNPSEIGRNRRKTLHPPCNHSGVTGTPAANGQQRKDDGSRQPVLSVGQKMLLERSEAHHVIASLGGVSSSAVSHWMNGTRRPSDRARQRLAVHLGIPADAWETELEQTTELGTDPRCGIQGLEGSEEETSSSRGSVPDARDSSLGFTQVNAEEPGKSSLPGKSVDARSSARPRPLEETLDLLIHGEPGDDPRDLLELVIRWLEEHHHEASSAVNSRLEARIPLALKETM